MSESEIDVVIECGFKKITHSIFFNLNGLKNSKKLADSGHVNRVREYCVNRVGQLISTTDAYEWL